MPRLHLFELEDFPWWPRLFRDAATDYLVTVIRRAKIYQGMAPRIAAAMAKCGTTQIVDLCSGGGGPWPDLLPALQSTDAKITATLTDKFPNVASLKRLAETTPGLLFETKSINATQVPSRLTGFRTIFTAFHHFRPAQAKAILAAAVRDRQGIAIAEACPRLGSALALQLFIPLAVLILTPTIRPFRWSRLFWTYVIPVLPLAIWFDGIVSTFRAYSPDEMLAMAKEVGDDEYDWEAGWDRPAGVPMPIPFLIGVRK